MIAKIHNVELKIRIQIQIQISLIIYKCCEIIYINTLLNYLNFSFVKLFKFKF